MFGTTNKEIQELKIQLKEQQVKHQEQINKMNSYFAEEKRLVREKNNEHWQNKIKSETMNFEKTFQKIAENLHSPEAKKACVKKFHQIILNTDANYISA